MRLASGLLALILVAAAVPALPARQPSGSASGLIVGQVVDAATSRPIAGAIVMHTGPPPAAGVRPRVLTGPDGRFLFRGLRRGSYGITAMKNGFAAGAYGRMRPEGPTLPLSLADGERVGDITIRMWRHAAISGSVVDETGERQIAVPVTAYRRTTVAGRRRFVQARTAATDDRGVFRLGGLIPGDYIVGTSTRYVGIPLSAEARGADARDSMRTSIARGDRAGVIEAGDAGLSVGRGTPVPPPGRAGLTLYPPTYHPFSTAGESAAVVTLRSGEEYEGADLRIAPVTTVSVSGMVIGPEGPVAMTPIRLVSGSTPESLVEVDWLVTQTDRVGRFTFPAVASGQYALRLLGGHTADLRREGPDAATIIWVDLPVAVGTENITGLSVVAQPGLRVSGRLEFDGNGPRTPARVQVQIEPVDSRAGTQVPPVTARVNTFGEFTSRGLPAGRYYVRVQNSPSGWMFLSATSNGRDVADFPLDLTGDVRDVTVTFTDRWSGIQGTVQNASGRDAGALVVVFPTDMDAWGSSGANPRRVRSVRTGKTGEYLLNLPPGAYHVAALPDEYAADWQDPSFMAELSRSATRVTIREGARPVHDLRTMELR